MCKPSGGDLARKLHDGAKAIEFNNMIGHQMAVSAFQPHLTASVAMTEEL